MSATTEQVFYRADVSANPRKNDAWNAWPDTGFVLVRSVGKHRPGRGLILGWHRVNRGWRALVIYYDEAMLRPATKVEWLPARQLIPVPVDPDFGT